MFCHLLLTKECCGRATDMFPFLIVAMMTQCGFYWTKIVYTEGSRKIFLFHWKAFRQLKILGFIHNTDIKRVRGQIGCRSELAISWYSIWKFSRLPFDSVSRKIKTKNVRGRHSKVLVKIDENASWVRLGIWYLKFLTKNIQFTAFRRNFMSFL